METTIIEANAGELLTAFEVAREADKQALEDVDKLLE